MTAYHVTYTVQLADWAGKLREVTRTGIVCARDIWQVQDNDELRHRENVVIRIATVGDQAFQQ